MKIVISPAKKMKECVQETTQRPCFLEHTKQLHHQLVSLTKEDVVSCMKCNEKIALQTVQQFKEIRFEHDLTPALLAYDGLQYRTMDPLTLSWDALNYLENHLFILSGFYGILKPNDGICSYRLEMKTKLVKGSVTDLVAYWGKRLAQTCYEENDVIINLASKEYSQCIQRHVLPSQRFITLHFVNDQFKMNSSEAKKARGAMVRYIAINQIENIEEIKAFHELGYQFSKSHSSENEWMFIKKMTDS